MSQPNPAAPNPTAPSPTAPNPAAPSQVAPLPPRSEEDAAYRPVSAPAVAGLVIAVIYVGLLLISALVKLIQGAPMFLPGWTMLLPVTAAGLSLVAWWLISNSEGTRAGRALAIWGFGLSSVAGLGYFAVEYFTGLALIQQANSFLMVMEPDSGFFPRLETAEQGEVNAAFLLTLPEGSRGIVDPRENRKMEILHDRSSGKGPGPLTKFREHFLVRAVTHGKKDVVIEPRGVQGWVHEKSGYIVTRNYHIATPEMVMDLVIPVASTEGDERKWFMLFPKIEIKSAELTPLGVALVNAGNRAVDVFREKLKGAAPQGFRDNTNWNKVAPEKPAQHFREYVKKWFLEGGPDFHQTMIPASSNEIFPWKVVNNHLQFTLFLKYRVTLLPENQVWMGEAHLVVEDTRPVVLDAQQMPEPGSVARERYEFRPVSVEFQRIANITKG